MLSSRLDRSILSVPACLGEYIPGNYCISDNDVVHTHTGILLPICTTVYSSFNGHSLFIQVGNHK